MTVRLTRHAAGDLEDARDFYAGVDSALRGRFLREVDVVIERLVMFPDGAAPVAGFTGLRRARMRQFPYGVFYRVEDTGDLLIVRILHAKQDQPAGLGE